MIESTLFLFTELGIFFAAASAGNVSLVEGIRLQHLVFYDHTLDRSSMLTKTTRQLFPHLEMCLTAQHTWHRSRKCLPEPAVSCGSSLSEPKAMGYRGGRRQCDCDTIEGAFGRMEKIEWLLFISLKHLTSQLLGQLGWTYIGASYHFVKFWQLSWEAVHPPILNT